MKRIFFLLLLAAVTGCALAQAPVVGKPFPYVKPLQFTFETPSLKTVKELKGKPLIIDFFATGCVACFNSMPGTQALQDAYGDRVNFLLVGKEDGQVQSTYAKVRQRYNLRLPAAFDSSIFRSMKISGVPRVVWVNADGTVYAHTNSLAVTRLNIDAFLAGKAYVDSTRR